MPKNRIPTYKASRILELYALYNLNKSQIAKSLNISRGTVIKYVGHYEQSELTYTDILLLSNKALIERVHPKRVSSNKQKKSERLIALFPRFHKRLSVSDANLKKLWTEYCQEDPSCYSYSQFTFKYHEWRQKNNIKKSKPNKWKIEHIESDDLKLLNKWRLSTDRNKWEKAIAILGLYKEENITDICKKVERSSKTIKKWVVAFTEKGLGNIDLRRTKRVTDEVKNRMDKKSEQIIKLLHEPPSLHNINRTSWSLKTLSNAYEEQYCESISKSTVSTYIRAKGYSFKKAKIVLTSPDPDYRKKLNNIKRILSELKDNEKFFSIDEYGPVAIKIRGGRSYTPGDQLNTIPQYQVSKGSLICTAALELSKNQITHFYSDKKNTTEMIKLLMILLESYKTEDRIFFSWDAASWHASKALDKKVIEVNDLEYRRINSTPTVELAPLPSSAQFLNVIESVFSGMAKAIIHNSNYQSVDECKKAIDRYFIERNKAFIENPNRAGKKIWGEEVVKPVFTDSNTCKDPNYR
jgi:transposase